MLVGKLINLHFHLYNTTIQGFTACIFPCCLICVAVYAQAVHHKVPCIHSPLHKMLCNCLRAALRQSHVVVPITETIRVSRYPDTAEAGLFESFHKLIQCPFSLP